MEHPSADLRRDVLQSFAKYVIGEGPGFAKGIGDRIEVKKLVYNLRDLAAVTACEITVMDDMLDLTQDALHPGCCAYIIDMCTALPFILLGLAEEQQQGDSKVSKFAMAPFSPSQRLEIVFHHAARLGARLRVISNSVNHSGAVLLISCEIWDVNEEQLVAYATHCKIMPKQPPHIAKLKL